MGNTDTNSVRKMLPTLLTDEDYIGAITGTAITLSQHAMSVPFIFKDGARLVSGTDYTFNRPVTITLSVAGADEIFIAQCDYAISDSDLETLIDRADRIIADYFVNDSMPATLYRSDWSAQLAASMFLKQYSLATKLEVARAKSMYDDVFELMKQFKSNTNATASDYSAVSSVGGMERTDVDPSDPSMHLDQGDIPTYD